MKCLVFVAFSLILFQLTVANPQTFISNGIQEVQVVPYHAHIYIRNSADEIVRLGSGVLISERHCLTVAFNIKNFNRWDIGLGSLNTSGLIFYRGTGGIVHEDYDPLTLVYNIGIIWIGAGVDISGPNVAPAILPGIGESIIANGRLGWFSAFGFLSPEGPYSDVLLTSRQTVLPNAGCESLFPVQQRFFGMFCSTDLIESSAPCGGEQGAGFVIEWQNQSVVLGLVSAISGRCNVGQAVTFYTNLIDYRLWIRDTVGI